MIISEVIECFKSEMICKGLFPPHQIIFDGQLHRFHIKGDKPTSKNGWYVLYTDNIPSGVFGNWKSDFKQIWSIKDHSKFDHSKFREFQGRMVAAIKLKNEVRIIKHQKVAELAKKIYTNCHAADPQNPYLLHKRVKAFHARQFDKQLVLPIIDFEGKLWSLQYILPNGEKRFLSGGAIKGHFIPIQNRPATDISILICEGFATGATLAAAYPDTCVIAACNANNLNNVAVKLREKLPKAELVICADADEIGLKRAKEATKTVGGILRVPKFPKNITKKLTDFNDLFCLHASKEEAT